MQSCYDVTNPNNHLAVADSIIQVARQRWFQRILENFSQRILHLKTLI